MSELTEAKTKTKTDAVWRVVIIAIFVIALIIGIGFPLLNGNLRSIFLAAPVLAFGILIAAIRSIRH